jgi:hypothetical protein
MQNDRWQDVSDPHGELKWAVRERIRPLLAAHGVPWGLVRCRAEERGVALDIHLDIPATLSPGTKHAVAVRVHDAVRAAGSTYGVVDVYVHDAVQDVGVS